MVQIHSPRPIPINPLTYRRQKTKRAPGKPPSAKRVSGCSKGSRIRQLKREGRVLIVKTCLTTPDLVFCKSRAGLPTRLLVGTGVIFREFATNRSTELVFREPALEVRFVRGAEGPTSFLTTRVGSMPWVCCGINLAFHVDFRSQIHRVRIFCGGQRLAPRTTPSQQHGSCFRQVKYSNYCCSLATSA